MRSIQTLQGQVGATRFEVTVVICLMLILLGVGLGYFRQLLSAAERASFEQELGAIRSAVGLKVLQTLMQNPDGMIELLPQNPIHWLEQPPQKYKGEYASSGYVAASEPGWYFIRQTHQLIYVPRHRRDVQTPAGTKVQIAYSLIPIYTDLNHNRQFDPKIDRLSAVKLKALQKVTWLEKNIF